MSRATSHQRLAGATLTAALVALLGAGCGPGPGPDGGADAGPHDGGATDGGATDGGATDDGGRDGGGDGGPPPIESLSRLGSLEDIDTLVGAQGLVKYLLPVEGQVQPPIEDCGFQNTTLYPYHLQFLYSLPGTDELTFDEYVDNVLRRPTRVWWGGEVGWRSMLVHPITAAPGVLLFTLYTEDAPGNTLIIDDVRAVHAALSACAEPFAPALAFAPVSNEQRIATAIFVDTLAEEGIGVVAD